MKLNFFGREITLKKEAAAAGIAVLLLLGCLTGYIFLREDNDIIIEAGSDPISAKTPGKAAESGSDDKVSPPDGVPAAPEAGVTAPDSTGHTDDTICVYVVGCVRNPGIVTIKKGQLINDAVKAAGGLTSDADAENINLVYSLNENVMLNIKSKQEPEQPKAQGKQEPEQPKAQSKQEPEQLKTQVKQKSEQPKAQGKQEPQQPKTQVKQAAAGLGEGAVLLSDSGSGAVISGGGADGTASPPVTGGGKNLVNINTAAADELDTLPGVGEATARDIIAFREKNGKFERIEDIMKVPRIKQNRFENIRDYITVN